MLYANEMAAGWGAPGAKRYLSDVDWFLRTYEHAREGGISFDV